MAADGLATQGARPSTAMVLTNFPQNIPTSQRFSVYRQSYVYSSNPPCQADFSVKHSTTATDTSRKISHIERLKLSVNIREWFMKEVTSIRS